MRLFAALLLLAFVGCKSEADRWADQLYECKVALYERGEVVYDVVDTSGWSIGGLPVWTTPDRVRELLGRADSGYPGAPWNAGYPAPFAERVSTHRYKGRGATYVFLGDSLAFLTSASLDGGSLRTDTGPLPSGSALIDIESRYPQSYECRSIPTQRYAALDSLSQTFIAVADTARGATVLLEVDEGGLVGAGIVWHRATDELIFSYRKETAASRSRTPSGDA